MSDKPNPDSGKTRQDAPDSGEVEWAEGFIPNPPAPGEARVGPPKRDKPAR